MVGIAGQTPRVLQVAQVFRATDQPRKECRENSVGQTAVIITTVAAAAELLVSLSTFFLNTLEFLSVIEAVELWLGGTVAFSAASSDTVQPGSWDGTLEHP